MNPRNRSIVLWLLLAGICSSCGASGAQVLDIGYNGKQVFVVDCTDASAKTKIEAWVESVEFVAGDTIRMVSRKNDRDQTFTYAFEVKHRGTWQLLLEDTNNQMGSATSMTEFRKVVAREMTSFVGTHRSVIGKP